MKKTTPSTKRPRSRRDPARLPFRWAMKSATREGEMYRRVVRDLRDQVGGQPSAAEELMIGRIAWLQVHLAHIDERTLRDGELSPNATREYLAWANSLSRMLQALGLAEKPKPAKTLAEHLAEKAAQAAAQAAHDDEVAE